MRRSAAENLVVLGLCMLAGLLWVQSRRLSPGGRPGRRLPSNFDIRPSEDQTRPAPVPSAFEKPPILPAGAASRSSMTVRELRIVDRDGRPVIRLGFSPEGEPGIWMRSASGKTVLEAGVHPDGFPFLLLADAEKRGAALASAEGINGAPTLVFRARDQLRLGVGLSPTEPGEPAFVARFSSDGTGDDLLGYPR